MGIKIITKCSKYERHLELLDHDGNNNRDITIDFINKNGGILEFTELEDGRYLCTADKLKEWSYILFIQGRLHEAISEMLMYYDNEVINKVLADLEEEEHNYDIEDRIEYAYIELAVVVDKLHKDGIKEERIKERRIKKINKRNRSR